MAFKPLTTVPNFILKNTEKAKKIDRKIKHETFKKKSNNPVRSFLKEWALFGLIIGGIILSRIYLWTPVRVDGHSMDPTLADSEYLLVINKLPIDRFDIRGR